jgi:isopentenyl phosphate kinase
MSGDKPDLKKIIAIAKIAKDGFVPISYGDVMWHGKNKFYILSGDRIMGILSKILKPRLVVFVLNVDGVYSDMKTKKLLYEIKGEKTAISEVKMDVTGGMSRKINEAVAISKTGVNVFLVNGNKPNRIVDAIKKGKFEGTLFRR